MSFKTSLIKTVIKCTPNKMVIWVANSQLKGIAELTDFSFDLETRKAFVQATLYGEEGVIEVLLDGFAVISEGDSHRFIIQQGQSNRPWLNNLLALIAGKEWKIPAIPQLTAQIGLISELFKAESESPAQEDSLITKEEISITE